MKYEDTIRAHPGYVHAALNAVDIFTRAFDDPTLGDEKLSTCDAPQDHLANRSGPYTLLTDST